MKLKEAYETYKKFKVPSLSEIRDTASEHSKTSLVIIILLVVLLLLALQYIPHLQVAQFTITNQKDLADAENNYRATLAQIFGGVAIAIGIYYTWRRITIAEEDLKATKEGQITERFTRAIDQLGAVDKNGNPAIEIRLGAIYALERIANESEKDYWNIIEILTAYVRKNSPISLTDEPIKVKDSYDENVVYYRGRDGISLDIQAILTVIGRLNCPNYKKFNRLDLQRTFLKKSQLKDANLERVMFTEANLAWSNLFGANLQDANLEEANLFRANLRGAILIMASIPRANLKKADLSGADLTKADLEGVNLEGADLRLADLTKAYLEGAKLKAANLGAAYFLGADFEEADLEGADLEGANLIGTKDLTVDQLSKVETLYKAELDPELEAELRAKGFGHLIDDEP